MSFNVQIVADSINTASPNRERIATLLCTFPRFILAELNTHRMFSRNSASSRAIPFRKMVEAVKNNPFIPIAWQKDHSGMQGTEYFRPDETFSSPNPMDRFAQGLTPEETDNTTKIIVDRLKAEWLWARDMAVQAAENLNNMGVFYHPNGDTSKLTGNSRGLTKQLCNRLLEPFMWHTALITATEWENFFALRCPQYRIDHTLKYSQRHLDLTFRSRKDYQKYCKKSWNIDVQFSELEWLKCNEGQGEIHIMKLAEMMWDALNESTPRELQAGKWHIPFGDQIESRELIKAWVKEKNIGVDEAGNFLHGKKEMPYDAYKLKVATARCAQTSYTLVGEEGKPMDYAKLIALHDRLLSSNHMSPMEHCAVAMSEIQYQQDYIKSEGYEVQRGWCKNYRGFIQYRAMIPGENHVLKE